MRLLVAALIIAAVYFMYTQTSVTGRDRSVTKTSTEGPAEQAGRVVDKAIYKAGEAIEEVGERIQQNTEPRRTP